MTLAQGFANLGSDAEGFALPRSEYTIQFPQDHAAHPEFRVEWWYITANLTAPDGTPYGLQWTLFRTALSPQHGQGWDSRQMWMGHAAVTGPNMHVVSERLARGGIGQAGVSLQETGFSAWIDNWGFDGDSGLTEMHLSASAPDFSYDMSLTASGPLVLQGKQGYSIKSPDGRASHYYSQPFYEIAGQLDLPDGPIAVSGTAWLDREWSSQPLGSDQTGWDWFSLSFEGGAKMMGFALRSETKGRFTSATWIAADGTATPYADGAFQATPLKTSKVAGRNVPTGWRVRLPERGLDVTVSALNRASWMGTSVPYWEGPVHVSGSHRGRGYLEMTGY